MGFPLHRRQERVQEVRCHPPFPHTSVLRGKMHFRCGITETLHNPCGRQTILVPCADKEMSAEPCFGGKKMKGRKSASPGYEHRSRAFFRQWKSVTDRSKQVH